MTQPTSPPPTTPPTIQAPTQATTQAAGTATQLAQAALLSPPIQLLSAIWNLWQSLMANGAARLQAHCGLSLKEFIALGYLQARAYTPAELAQAVQMPRYEVSRLLSDLETAGFVARCRHQSDGRQVSVTITASGQAAWEAGLMIAQEVAEPYLSGLSGPQRSELIRTLTGLSATHPPQRNPEHVTRADHPEGKTA